MLRKFVFDKKIKQSKEMNFIFYFEGIYENTVNGIKLKKIWGIKFLYFY